MSINALRHFLPVDPKLSDDEVIAEWKKRTQSVCKPCWELKYCPYGPLVEEFPLPPVVRNQALEHNEYLKKCLQDNVLGDGSPLDEERRLNFQEMVGAFKEEDYPESISSVDEESSCTIFGHLCPVFFVNEPFTETAEMRRIGRYIPFNIKIRVARRDNYTCQICGKHLRDDELEFDHIIPVSRGGSTEEHNIRLACFDCNRSKSANVDI
ncbi:HNH endonuclease [Anaerosporomusa subterranea]|nr:HNH endonuclease [Anaerosporomusa subterranea]